jgi:hypothetical protein
VPPPEQLERLLLTPQYQYLRNRLFGFFLNFLVRTELVGKKQAGQIMNLWQENNPAKLKKTRMWIRENPTLPERDLKIARNMNPRKTRKHQRLQGCGFVGTKAGPLSQHIHACN